MIPGRPDVPRFTLAMLTLVAALAAAGSAPPSRAADPAQVEAEPAPTRQKGKWPWFRKHRKAAQPVPAPTTPPPAESVTDLTPAPAPQPAPGADRPGQPRTPAHHARRQRSTPAQPGQPEKTAAPVAATAPPQLARRPQSGPLPRSLRRFDASARAAVDLPGAGGARPVRSVTQRPSAVAAIEPLQQRLAGIAGTPPATMAAAHADLAGALLAHDLDREAVAEALVALSLDSGSSAAWAHAGTALRRLGALALARDAAEEGVRLQPDSGEARYRLAQALEAQGHRGRALEVYVEALELDPSLWLPERNPGIVSNRLAQDAVHRRHMLRNQNGGVLLSGPAP